MRDLLAVGLVVLLVLLALSMATTLRWRYRDHARIRGRRCARRAGASSPRCRSRTAWSSSARMPERSTGRDGTIPKARDSRAARLLISGAPLGDRPRPAAARSPKRRTGQPWPRSSASGGDVAIDTDTGRVLVECGSIRQQVSQELARSVFDAVKRAVEADDDSAPRGAG